MACQILCKTTPQSVQLNGKDSGSNLLANIDQKQQRVKRNKIEL